MSDPNPYASPSVPTQAMPGSPPGGVQGSVDAVLATRWQRFWGSLIDGLVILPPLLIVTIVIVFLLEEGFDETSQSPWQSEFVQSLLGLFVGVSLFLAIHGYLLATRGQTVGKYLLHMQIVSNDGQLLPLWRLIATRYLPMWLLSLIPGVGGLISLANALAIFRESRKCFHDDIAGTKVIQLDRLSPY
jgi:uncharacterized RDD family membrane protein YckC